MQKLLTLLLVFMILLSSCKKPESFEYRDIKNIRIENWQSEKSRVAMDIVYYNPNNYGVNLKKVDCDIYIDSNFIGKFQLDTLMHIAKASEFILPAKMEVDMRKVFSNALNVIMGNEVLIGAKGTTRVGKGGIYVTVPFSYEGKHKLNLF